MDMQDTGSTVMELQDIWDIYLIVHGMGQRALEGQIEVQKKLQDKNDALEHHLACLFRRVGGCRTCYNYDSSECSYCVVRVGVSEGVMNWEPEE